MDRFEAQSELAKRIGCDHLHSSMDRFEVFLIEHSQNIKTYLHSSMDRFEGIIAFVALETTARFTFQYG